MPRLIKKATPAYWSKKKDMSERTYKEPRYNTRRWRKARLAFIKNNPLCVVCNKLATVVDHIKPVRLGGEFWNSENWQSMCATCHNRKSGNEARLK